MEVDGADSRKVHLGVYPTPSGWIEHPISLGLRKRMGVGWDGSYKARAGESAKEKSPVLDLRAGIRSPQPETGSGFSA